jgi:hypothetical protein
MYESVEDTFYMPYFTILLLLLAVFKWSGLPQVGKALNYIGKTAERLVFSLIQSFEAETNHPVTGEPLIDVVNPDTREEIVDVAAYNDKFFVAIESKFWDCPLLADLENELKKFEKKVDFLESNIERLGFPRTKVIPVFYTPFAPYASWQRIQLIPSRFLLSMYLFKFFQPKKPKLLIEDERLRQLVSSKNYPFPYPVDAHSFDKSIKMNTCRIQDGLIISFDEHEVDVEILNPLGHSFSVPLDINEKTYQELERQGIRPGALIRMGIVNLSGSWTISQILYFEKINEKDPQREINEIWGDTPEAKEIMNVFKKHGLDIFKFIEFCKRRAPVKGYWPLFVAARMGTVLQISETFDFVGQCECGQIMGFPKERLESRKLIGGGKVLCQSCLQELHKRGGI